VLHTLGYACLQLAGLGLVLGALEWCFPNRPGQRRLRAQLTTDLAFYFGQHLIWLGVEFSALLTVRALLAPFDATFVAGRAQADRLRRAGVPNVVHVPFGVDGGLFRPLEPSAERAGVRQELLGSEASAGAALLVGVGRFAIEKRWDVVLDAFARVRARRDAVLVLFGDGPERARLERSAPRGVRFAGFETNRTRLARAVGAADVLVHGCPYETYGLGVAEAVACAVPVVVPDAGGAAESADPTVAEAYASLDAAACAAAIDGLLARRDRDPSELRARALAAAARVPTLESHYATVLATYASLRGS